MNGRSEYNNITSICRTATSIFLFTDLRATDTFFLIQRWRTKSYVLDWSCYKQENSKWIHAHVYMNNQERCSMHVCVSGQYSLVERHHVGADRSVGTH